MSKNEYEKQRELALKKLREALPKAADTLIALLESRNKEIRIKAASAIREIISRESVKTIIIIK